MFKCDVICCDGVSWHESFLCFQHIWPHLDMRVSGRRHHGRRRQLGGEDQGGRWHQDVLLRLEFFQLGRNMLWWWWVTWEVFFIYVFNLSDHIKYMRVGGRWHRGTRTMTRTTSRKVGSITLVEFLSDPGPIGFRIYCESFSFSGKVSNFFGNLLIKEMAIVVLCPG